MGSRAPAAQEAPTSVTTTKDMIPILKRNDRLRKLHEKHLQLMSETQEEELNASGDPKWLAAFDSSLVIFPELSEDDISPNTSAKRGPAPAVPLHSGK